MININFFFLFFTSHFSCFHNLASISLHNHTFPDTVTFGFLGSWWLLFWYPNVRNRVFHKLCYAFRPVLWITHQLHNVFFLLETLTWFHNLILISISYNILLPLDVAVFRFRLCWSRFFWRSLWGWSRLGFFPPWFLWNIGKIIRSDIFQHVTRPCLCFCAFFKFCHVISKREKMGKINRKIIMS